MTRWTKQDLENFQSRMAQYRVNVPQTIVDAIEVFEDGGEEFDKNGTSVRLLESVEQRRVVEWFDANAGRYGLVPLLLFAIPNGGKRKKAEAAILTWEGVRPGIPDLFLAVGKMVHLGLFIEMKQAGGGRVSEAQRHAMMHLEAQGYKVVVCHGANAAINIIKKYLEG